MAPPTYYRIPALAFALVAIFMGCIVDAMVKHLGGRYGAVLIAFCRYGFGAVFALIAFLGARQPLPNVRTQRAHALRSCASTSSAVLFFHSLSLLQLAEATVLIFCAPLLIAPLARLILGERFRPMALLAIGIGFLGVLVTVIGAPAATSPRHLEGVISGLAAALLYSLSIVLLRQLAQRDEALTAALLGNVFPFLFLLGPTLWLRQAPLPADLPVLALLGLIGFTLWFLLTRAYARAAAQSLAISEYSALIWSAGLGFLVFREFPGWQVWAGAAVICSAIGLSAWDSRRTARRGAADALAAGPGVLPG
jgi:S-adenosylmethionine uptake transporter